MLDDAQRIGLAPGSSLQDLQLRSELRREIETSPLSQVHKQEYAVSYLSSITRVDQQLLDFTSQMLGTACGCTAGECSYCPRLELPEHVIDRLAHLSSSSFV